MHLVVLWCSIFRENGKAHALHMRQSVNAIRNRAHASSAVCAAVRTCAMTSVLVTDSLQRAPVTVRHTHTHTQIERLKMAAFIVAIFVFAFTTILPMAKTADCPIGQTATGACQFDSSGRGNCAPGSVCNYFSRSCCAIPPG